MKLYKENRTDQEWELPNTEIAKKFLESEFNNGINTERNLVLFLTEKDGLNSIWDWDKEKGSIEGSKDMLEILNIIYDSQEELRKVGDKRK